MVLTSAFSTYRHAQLQATVIPSTPGLCSDILSFFTPVAARPWSTPVPEKMALSLRTHAASRSMTGRRLTTQRATFRPIRATPCRAVPLSRRASRLIPAAVPDKAEDKPSEQDATGSPNPEEAEDGSPAQLARQGRTSPMADDKRSVAEQQGAAPEGDKAILGQAYQPTGKEAYSETPEQRYGSTEAYEEAMEASKDRSRKSEQQTGEGANFSEGSA